MGVIAGALRKIKWDEKEKWRKSRVKKGGEEIVVAFKSLFSPIRTREWPMVPAGEIKVRKVLIPHDTIGKIVASVQKKFFQKTQATEHKL